jgi:hypothetical protein
MHGSVLESAEEFARKSLGLLWKSRALSGNGGRYGTHVALSFLLKQGPSRFDGTGFELLLNREKAGTPLPLGSKRMA